MARNRGQGAIIKRPGTKNLYIRYWTNGRQVQEAVGSDDPKAGAVSSVMQVLNHPQLNHKVEVQSGVLAGRSAELLQKFFKSRR